MTELPIPPAALKDEKSRELIRLWAADNEQHAVLDTSVWDDPAAWGIALVDLAKHVARSYEQNKKYSFDDAFRRIREGMDAELSHPTDEGKGSI